MDTHCLPTATSRSTKQFLVKPLGFNCRALSYKTIFHLSELLSPLTVAYFHFDCEIHKCQSQHLGTKIINTGI